MVWIVIGGLNFLGTAPVSFAWYLGSAAFVLLGAILCGWLRFRSIKSVARLADKLEPACKDRHTAFLDLSSEPDRIAVLASREIEAFFQNAKSLPPMPRSGIPTPALLASSVVLAAVLLGLNHYQESRRSQMRAISLPAANLLSEASKKAGLLGQDKLAEELQDAALRLSENIGSDPIANVRAEIASAVASLESSENGAGDVTQARSIISSMGKVSEDTPGLREALLQGNAVEAVKAMDALDEDSLNRILAETLMNTGIEPSAEPAQSSAPKETPKVREMVSSMLRNAMREVEQEQQRKDLASALREMQQSLGEGAGERNELLQADISSKEKSEFLEADSFDAVAVPAMESVRSNANQSDSISMESKAESRKDFGASPDLSLPSVSGAGEAMAFPVQVSGGESVTAREYQNRLSQQIVKALSAAEFEDIPPASRQVVRSYFESLRPTEIEKGAGP